MYNLNGITVITGVNVHKIPNFVNEYNPTGRRNICQPKKRWRRQYSRGWNVPELPYALLLMT
jgi:hypothetical protein